MSEDNTGGYVRHKRVVSVGEYENIEQEAKLPLKNGDDPEERLDEAANLVDRSLERRTGKRLTPESRRTGKTYEQRKVEADAEDINTDAEHKAGHDHVTGGDEDQ